MRKNNVLKKMTIIKEIISKIVLAVIILLSVYSTFLVTQSIIYPEKKPDFFGIKMYVILSGSMSPSIEIGDIAIVKEVSSNELKVGDIISYRDGQSITTHRIIEIKKIDGQIYFSTKGDANNIEDNKSIEINSIEGKVIKIIPKLGKIPLFLKNKTVIIVILFLLFSFYFIRSNKRLKDSDE